MISIVLKNPNTEHEITLNPQQVDVLLREIKRTSGSWFMRIIWLFFPWLWQRRTEGLLELVSPDAEITIDNNGRVESYQLFARSIIVDESTGRPRQFYMGLLLLEWLEP
jgi:hypothetical protein